MQELVNALQIYAYGISQIAPDGSTTLAYLPDYTLPSYSSYIPGTAGTGLQQQHSYPTGTLGFGTDLSVAPVNLASGVPDPSLTIDFTHDFAEVDPNSPVAVAQAVYRRLTTNRNILKTLNDSPDYGIDIVGFLQKGLTPKEIQSISGKVKSELLKDDRIDPSTLEVSVTTPDAQTLEIDIQGTTTTGPFSLVLSIDNAGSVLKAISGNS